ncbi:hypothetical protein JXA80_14190 [bacterium]|nr:hypothetical protein [candidate division CSSED10-310 bacterium]
MKLFFRKRQETAVFHLPESGQEIRQLIEYREDALIGRTSVISEGLLQKASIFFGETDAELIRDMIQTSRQTCFFCPPAVFKATPTYAEAVCPGGRMRGQSTLLFPNLFPLAAIHSVLTWPDHHFLRPGEFSSERLTDLFLLAGQFIAAIRRVYPDIRFLSLNCNYMPPAGASVLHPHFQILGSREPAHRLREVMDAAGVWHQTNGHCYWNDLIDVERRTGDRWVGMSGDWAWLTPWSPLGSNEVMGIHESAETVFDLEDNDWRSLADGLSRVLKMYDDQHYSSFNVCLTGGCCDTTAGQRCVIRVISRQNVRSLYRNDEYFLQKIHGIELIVSPPERVAADLRPRFES